MKEQLALQLKLAEAVGQARRAALRLREARSRLQKEGASEGAARLETLLARIETGGGSYPQLMLIDQLANVARMIGQADQKVGRDAFTRFDDLMKELAAVKAEAAKLGVK